jgi:putative flippase GtrA
MILFLKRQTTFIRYVLVGILGTSVDLGSLYLLVQLSGITPHQSWLFPVFVTVAFMLAVVNNYILNRIWTFQSQTTQISAEFMRFFVVSLAGLLFTQVLMWLFISLGIWYLLAKALTSLSIMVWNFALNKLWTFRTTDPQTTTESSKSSIAMIG